MSFVLGLDPSVTSFGVALVNDQGGVEHVSAIAPDLKGVERLAWFRAEMRNLLVELDPVEDLVVLEGYAFSRVNLTHLGELCGMVKLMLWDLGLVSGGRALIATPSALKKFVSGKGNANKDVMRLEVYKRFGFEAKTQDEVEAYALAMLGVHWLDEQREETRLTMRVPVAHLEGLKKVEVMA